MLAHTSCALAKYGVEVVVSGALCCHNYEMNNYGAHGAWKNRFLAEAQRHVRFEAIHS